jgi:hypothetical protein
MGYVVEKIYEVWHFDRISQYDERTRNGGVFAEYINTFLKIKQECSGWPSWCESEEDKQRYIRLYFEKEGIKLEYDKICKNPGMRALAKLMLNSFWGKFGQRDNMPQIQYVHDPNVLYDKLTSSNTKVMGLNFVSDNTVAVNWQHDDDFPTSSGKTNVVIAAYTTTQARLHLYRYLSRLNTRVLYCDTDSIVFFSRRGEWKPSLGDFLGELTDEVPNNSIQAFVTGGPKNYAYMLQHPDEDGTQTCCKVRGITLNHRNQLLINFDTIQKMIRSNNDEVVKVVDQTIIARDKNNTKLLTTSTTKDYKVVFDKRRRLNPFVSVPFGY